MSESRSPRALVYAALLVQTALSAGTYLAAKRALAEVGPMALAALRFTGASACFAVLVWAFVRGARVPPRRWWARVALLGLVGVPLNQGLFLSGLARTTPAHAALMYALTPLFVFLIALALRSERAEPAKLAGLFVAVVGAATVALERGAPQPGGAPLAGDLFVLGACVSWAAYTVLGKPLVAAQGPIAATAWTLITGTVLFLPVGVPASASLPFAALTPTFWWTLAFLVFLTSVVSYLCWFYALGALEPSRVAVFSNLQPVATALLAWAVFDEAISPRLALGGLLVIAGVLVTTQVRGAVLAPRAESG